MYDSCCGWPALSYFYVSILDINDFYTFTLDDSSKPVEVKTVATYQLAEKWENVSPPVPTDSVEIAKKILDDVSCTLDPSKVKDGILHITNQQRDWPCLP